MSTGGSEKASAMRRFRDSGLLNPTNLCAVKGVRKRNINKSGCGSLSVSYYILSKPLDFENKEERALLRDFLKLKAWELRKQTPHRSRIRVGDHVLFYASAKSKAFIGNATVSRAPFKTTEEEYKRHYLQPLSIEPDYLMGLDDIEIWRRQLPIKPLVGRLGFVKNKKYYGALLMRGVTEIPKSDFEKILRARK